VAFDPRNAVNGIRALIRIQTPPEYDPRTGSVRPGALYGFDTFERGGPGDDLLSVTTTKRLAEPCGRATLHFVPREPVAGYTWADLLPPYSLVEIRLQRYPDNPEPVLVFLGLTGATLQSEDYSRAEPERSVQVTAREVTCVFVDGRVLYLPVQPTKLAPRFVAPLFQAETDQFGRTSQLEQDTTLPGTASSAVALFGMLAIDPRLANEGESPADAIDRFVRMVTVGVKTDYNPTALPLLNFDFPDARLKDLIYFDKTKAGRQLFDPNAQLPASAQLTGDQTSLWALMQTWCDPHYQELFALPRDQGEIPANVPASRSLSSAMEVVFRRPPFGARISTDGEVVDIPAAIGPQFDRALVSDPLQNVEISDSDVVGTSRTRSCDQVRNLFLVYPVVPGWNNAEEFRAIHAPLIDNDRLAPSSARRFGPRLMELGDYYMRVPQSSADKTQDAFEQASSRERLLWAWHRFEPLFWKGQYTIKGNVLAQVGKRLVDRRPRSAMEFYVTAVTHSMTLGTQDPHFVSSLGVERGWPLP